MEGPWPCPHGSTSGSTCASREKAESTQAQIVGNLHAGVFLSVIGAFLPINMRSFVHKKVS